MRITPSPQRLALIAVLLASFGLAEPVHAALPTADAAGTPLPSLAPMLERVTPAVVNIHSQQVQRVRNPLAEDPFLRRFFGIPDMPQERVRQSLGSGVIVDADSGLVLTNNHVIEGADDISVTLADGRTLVAELVGSDPDTDVALVRVAAENLVALPLADSKALRVGDFVVAVGNPFGLGQTVTSGIVSALGRNGLRGLGYQNFIQTDASINPGNSGGALVNLRGELIGINSAIFSPSGGNIGIGFAIPASLANEVMRQLLAYGEVRRGNLGVATQDITPELADVLALGAQSRGALVARVETGSPAEQAGVRVGDVITQLDDQPVLDRAALHNIEGLLPVGKPIRIGVNRDGKPLRLKAVLKARPKELAGDALDPRLSGALFAEIPERLRQGGVTGVVVSKVERGSRAAINGMRAGDLITAIGRRRIDGLSSLQSLADAAPRELALQVTRGQRAGVLLMQ
ncbi:MAG: heat-shock protein [Lysobacterales bacterium CG17_big_fil_post_rev_8_21_14_2_50_64_11]|nr:MAG: heat-shock protein [Xanthomonadales bacterium CG17_big_fil_post_rev_8_21_14_2_50_64_11]PIX60582.1 MAG: heat-shock protein [Xanthomonadales bacterium CG_4_10_14_3_um_filter_64_11]